MASRNDPAKLEAEANALVEQYQKAREESLKAQAPEDTPPQPEPEEVQEETPPEEPQETEAEVKARDCFRRCVIKKGWGNVGVG